jgi:hypothetical protein
MIAISLSALTPTALLPKWLVRRFLAELIQSHAVLMKLMAISRIAISTPIASDRVFLALPSSRRNWYNHVCDE